MCCTGCAYGAGADQGRTVKFINQVRRYYDCDGVMPEKMLFFIDADTIDKQEFERIYKSLVRLKG